MKIFCKEYKFRRVEDAKAWHRVVVNNVLDDPWDVKYYIGWRKKLRKIKNGVTDLFSLKQDMHE